MIGYASPTTPMKKRKQTACHSMKYSPALFTAK